MCCECEKLENLYNKELAKISVLINKTKSLENTLKSKDSELSQLKEQLAWFKKQIFGQKSERLADIPGDNPLLPGLELPEEVVQEEKDFQRPKRKGSGRPRKKGNCTLKLPKDLPVETTIKELTPEERIDPETGLEMVEFSSETVDKLACKPGTWYIKRYIYKKYKLPNNSSAKIKQKDAVDSILPGSKFDESVMAKVITDKLAYHIPFYRQQEMLKCSNIDVKRQTLSSMFVNLGQKLKPLYDVLKVETLSCGYINTDDTPARMLKPGNGKTVEVRMWGYESAGPNAPPYMVFDFSTDHKQKHPIDFLENYHGIIHADAFGGYVKLDADSEVPIKWAACWAHARRYYVEAEAGDQKLKFHVLRTIRNIYRYEKVAKHQSAKVRLKIRQECEKPLVDGLFEYLKEKLRTVRMLPKENLTKAVNYMLKYEKNLKLFLEDPNISIDNNSGERMMRKVVIGKKNWMFVGSPKAGESMAILYSFVQSCRALKIDPQKYLEDVFRRLQAHPHKNLKELLPNEWLKEKASSDDIK